MGPLYWYSSVCTGPKHSYMPPDTQAAWEMA